MEPKQIVGTEEKSSVPVPAEEKSSVQNAGFEHKTEDFSSAGTKRLKRYDGSGRRTNDEEMDEILDAYLMWNILPQDVSDRQRRDYKKHPRLELRRLHLEQTGQIKKHRATAKNETNVLDLKERKAQRARDAS